MNEQKVFPPSTAQGETVCERHDKKLSPKFFAALAGGVFWGGLVSGYLEAAPISAPESRQQDMERNSTITNNSQSIFIGEDAETGDRVIRVTPPRQPATQQPSIPYVIPEVSVPWQSGGGQGNQYPPEGGNNGGIYPPQRPDRPLPPGSSYPDSPFPRPDRPSFPPDSGGNGAPSPSHPSTRPPYPGGTPSRPDQPGRPPAGGNWGAPPHGTPKPDAGRPGYPGQPGGPSAWRPTWRPQWIPGQSNPNAGGAFVYQPGRELPRYPANNHPYAPLGPSGPVVLPPNRR